MPVIYGLFDPATQVCRYIGKANNLEARIRCHRWEVNNTKVHTRRANWLRSLGCEPMVVVLQEVNSETWQEAERWWISKMRTQSDKLTNFADGGLACPIEGIGHAEETKAKLRKIALERKTKPPSMDGWNKGMKMSQEFCEKNKRSHLGVPWSKARREAQNRLKERGK